MDGLIIKKHWLDLILSGKKTWEIRGSDTKKRGRIALIESGSGHVVGTCKLVDSYPVTLDDMEANQDKHCIEPTLITITHHLKYKYPNAWVLENAKRIDPVKYNHPQGAVIWVKNVYDQDKCFCGGYFIMTASKYRKCCRECGAIMPKQQSISTME